MTSRPQKRELKLQLIDKPKTETMRLGDRYRTTMLIAEGGMGTVYLGIDEATRQEVAIKVLRPLVSNLIGSRERFEREIELLATLSHPAIVPLLDHGVDKDGHFLVMPFVAGQTLDKHLDGSPRPLSWWLPTLGTVCHALTYAHDRGVVHRDLKPANLILIDSAGAAQVLDFGIALDTNKQRLTHHGIVIGTATYMAPEQFVEGAVLTPATDIYTLATVTYEVLAGHPPFTDEAYTTLVFKHSLEEPRALQEVNPKITHTASNVVMRALSKNPDDRYQSALTFHDALEAALKAQ